jgi:RNA polymerase sigma-70 factor (ECF subfamily)
MENCNPEILKGLQEGDEKSFETIFHTYYAMLFNYAKSYVIDKEIARELTQEALLKLWEIKAQLKTNSNIPALLLKITHNNSLNYLNRNLAKQRYIEHNLKRHYVYQLNCIALNETNSEKIIFDELNEKINKAIMSLPPKCREVFELSRFKELKYKEIAESLNISVKTVENHISEALKRILEQIQEYI